MIATCSRATGLRGAVVASVLAIAGCGGAAPGAGVDSPQMPETMPRTVSASEALSHPHLPSVDPGTMRAAEVDNVLSPGPRCGFAYTAQSPPILVAAVAGDGSGTRAVTKIHGLLVPLSGRAGDLQTLARGGEFSADGMTLQVNPDEASSSDAVLNGERRAANLLFSIPQGLTVGYRGWYVCVSDSDRV